MTGIPTVPGPFAFLESAGEALGSYAQEKEERKRHAQQLAEHGMNSLLQDILQGLKPAEMLDDPNVAAMSKTAYGYAIPRGILPQPKEILQKKQAAALQTMKPGGAAERAATGVPSEEVAGAAESKAKLEGRTAEAKLSAGVPEAEAETQAAIATALKEGANLNVNIFRGANALLGKDKRFARLAYEAATGALDARFKYLEQRRADLTIERQKMVDRLSIARDELKEVGSRFDKAQKAWEAQQQLFLLDKGDTPENRRAFAEANPPPDENEIAEKYIQSVHGYGREEFQRRLNQITEELTKPDVTGTTQAQPTSSRTEVTGRTPATQPSTGSAKVGKTIARLSKADPEEAAEALADLVSTDDLVEEEADAIKFRLRETMPGSWFKKFNRAYAGSRLGK